MDLETVEEMFGCRKWNVITRPDLVFADESVWQYHAWMGVVNAVLDFANIIAAVVLVWNLKMEWRIKALVLALFSMRLLSVRATIHIHHKRAMHRDD